MRYLLIFLLLPGCGWSVTKQSKDTGLEIRTVCTRCDLCEIDINGAQTKVNDGKEMRVEESNIR